MSDALAMTLGPNGDLFVQSCYATAVHRYDGRTGEYLGRFTQGVDLAGPRELVFGPDGDLYVTNTGTNQVYRFDGKTGEFLGPFTTEFGNAQEMIFESDGDALVGEYRDAGHPGIYRVDAATGERHDPLVAVSFHGGLVRTTFLPPAGVLENDSDPDLDPISAVLVDGPAHGTLTINGVGYEFDPAAVGTIAFGGNGGTDAAVLTGATGSESLRMEPGAAALRGTGLSVDVTGTESIVVDGGGGTSTARLYDSPGDDAFTARPGDCTLSGDAYLLRAVGFRYVWAYATAGGHDLATLDGSPGNDVFLGDLAKGYAVSYGSGFYHRAESFDSATARSAGGVDVARLYDGPQHDTLRAGPTETSLAGPAQEFHAEGFRYVAAYSAAGGSDEATLYDSPGSDRLEAAGSRERLSYADRQIEVTGFHRVKAISSRGGHDTFHLDAVDFLFLLQGPWFYS